MNSNNENIINIDLDWFECEALLAAIKVINDWFVSRTTTSEFDQHSLWFIYMKVEKKWWDVRHIKAYIFDLKSIFAVHFFLGRLFVHSFVSIGNIKHELSLN